MHKALSPNQVADGAERKERAEWDHGRQPRAGASHDGDSCHGTHDRGKHDCEEYARGPEESSYHGKKLDVPPSETLLAPEELVGHCNRIQEASSKENSQKGILPGEAGGQKRKRQPRSDTGQGKNIWNGECIQVYECNENEQRDKDRFPEQLHGKAILLKEEQGDGTRESLHRGVAKGYGRTAVAAFAHQDQIADEGDIVIERYGPAALGAVRSGLHNGKLCREPVDDHVEEAPQATSQDEYEHLLDPVRNESEHHSTPDHSGGFLRLRLCRTPTGGVGANPLGAVLSVLLLHHDGECANGTGFLNELPPKREIAFGITAATIKAPTGLAPLLHKISVTAFPRALDSRRNGSGILALGITAAGEKRSKPTLLHDHGTAAFLADLICHRIRCGGCILGLDGLGAPAFGIIAAGEEGPVFSPLHDHWTPALLACLPFHLLPLQYSDLPLFIPLVIGGEGTLGVSAAGEEGTVSAQPDVERMIAHGTLEVGRQTGDSQIEHIAPG